MIKLVLFFLPTLTLTVLLLLCTYLTRFVSTIAAVIAWGLSGLMCFIDSKPLEKLIMNVLACGELSCFISRKQEEEKNGKKKV